MTLAALAGSVALTVLLPRQYEATASILVSPLPEEDQTFLGLGLLRDTGDPTRTVQTAATLVETFETAELTAQRVNERWDAEAVLDAVRVEPQGESNVLAITAAAGEPAAAARLANEFTRTSLGLREDDLRRQLDAAIEQLEAQGAGTTLGTTAEGAPISVAERLSELETLRDRGADPTLSLSQPAEPPVAPVGAPRWLIVLAALIAGLTVGTLGAFALESVNPRVRDQEEFAALFPIEVLAGVPRLSRRQRGASPVLPPVAKEAHRTLRMQLEQSGNRRTILVTSASSGDGKTTAAANLSYSMIDAGRTVVLIDFDLRKPGIADAIGVRPVGGLSGVLMSTPLERLLVERPHAPGLRVLPAVEGDVVMLEAISRRMPELLAQAAEMADYVIIDTPPLGEVSDPLQLLDHVDDVVVVARPRHTFRRSFQLMRDLLARARVQPVGLFIVGHVPQPTYYGYLPMPSGDGAGLRPGPADRRPASARGAIR